HRSPARLNVAGGPVSRFDGSAVRAALWVSVGSTVVWETGGGGHRETVHQRGQQGRRGGGEIVGDGDLRKAGGPAAGRGVVQRDRRRRDHHATRTRQGHDVGRGVGGTVNAGCGAGVGAQAHAARALGR